MSLFENFNAKNTTPIKVAKTFIAPNEFYDIAKLNHTLVLGPRGCGKTTLFKMLTPEALDGWNAKESRKAELSRKKFIGIYIPSDEVYNEQFRWLGDGIDEEANFTLLRAVFSNNVFLALLDTLSYLKKNQYIKNPVFWVDLSRDIIRTLRLSVDTAPNLNSIRRSLLDRYIEFNIAGSRLKSGQDYSSPEYFSIDFFTAIRNVCTLFKSTETDYGNVTWMLLFDECELLPDEIFQSLLQRIRAIPPGFVFKLSAAPLATLKIEIENAGEYAPRHNDDYETVLLWPSIAKDNFRFKTFIQKLANRKLHSFFIENYDLHTDRKTILDQVFGSFTNYDSLKDQISIHPDHPGKKFSELVDKESLAYGINSIEFLAIKEYAFIDSAFERFIIQKNINPREPIFSVKQRNQFIRKVFPYILLRLCILKRKISEDGVVELKEFDGNEVPKYYYGSQTLVSIVDGNPRHLIGLLNQFEPFFKAEIANNGILINEIKYNIQYDIYIKTAKRLLYKCKGTPIYNSRSKTANTEDLTHLHQLIIDLGNELKKKALYSDLKSGDISTTFSIPEQSIDTVKVIENQLKGGSFIGALVGLKMNKGGYDPLKIDLKDQEFRLAYLFSPFFKIPLRQGKSFTLTEVFINETLENNSQYKLFDE